MMMNDQVKEVLRKEFITEFVMAGDWSEEATAKTRILKQRLIDEKLLSNAEERQEFDFVIKSFRRMALDKKRLDEYAAEVRYIRNEFLKEYLTVEHEPKVKKRKKAKKKHAKNKDG